MRRAMGIAVFSGMIGVTAFGLFLTPIFYVLLRSFVAGPKKDEPPVEKTIPSPKIEHLKADVAAP
jgi:multidrug efflux pump